MGKRSRSDNASGEGKNNDSASVGKTVLVESKAVDPTLALLFASSVSLNPPHEVAMEQSH
jgi:nucleolar protein 12